MEAYSQNRLCQFNLNHQLVQVISKPGFPAWDQINPSIALLAENVSIAAGERVYHMGCGHGALAVLLSRQADTSSLYLTDISVIALNCARQTLEINQVNDARIVEDISLLPEQANTFDVILIDQPKGRLLGRRWLVEAFGLLREGGTLYLAGANGLGIQSLIQDGNQLFSNLGILAYKKGSRLAKFVKNRVMPGSAPAWASEPGVSPASWDIFTLSIGDQAFTIYNLPGVFSHHKLDEGTALLLQHLPLASATRIIDIGCGYGLIGMVAARRLQAMGHAFEVDLIDSNLLAVASARKNIVANQIVNANAFSSDLFAAIPGRRYHQILSNPPFHAGKEVDYAITEALIQQSFTALEPGGELVIVANRFIRYDQYMSKFFSNIRIPAENNRFHIIVARK